MTDTMPAKADRTVTLAEVLALTGMNLNCGADLKGAPYTSGDAVGLAAWQYSDGTKLAPELAKRLECARFIAAFDACRGLTVPRSYALCPSESAAAARLFTRIVDLLPFPHRSSPGPSPARGGMSIVLPVLTAFSSSSVGGMAWHLAMSHSRLLARRSSLASSRTSSGPWQLGPHTERQARGHSVIPAIRCDYGLRLDWIDPAIKNVDRDRSLRRT